MKYIPLEHELPLHVHAYCDGILLTSYTVCIRYIINDSKKIASGFKYGQGVSSFVESNEL